MTSIAGREVSLWDGDVASSATEIDPSGAEVARSEAEKALGLEMVYMP